MSTSSRRDRRQDTASTRASRARRGAPPPSFVERYRAAIIGVVIVGAIGAIVLIGLAASGPAWACSTVWSAAETPQPAPGATSRVGYVQPDLGREHISVGVTQRYPICPPASGKHASAAGEGPIPPRVYGPEDDARPQGWIHNLEHGGMVILYRCAEGDDGCDDAAQQRMRELFSTFPPSPICGTPAGSSGPVFARFDEMSTPYTALLWGLILPLDTLDRDRILAFWAQDGDRTNPEPACARPTPTPPPTLPPTPTPSPSDTPEPSPSAS